MKKTVYLYVERDDSEYDYKAGFASYTEANDYRQECQRSWMGHCDYVYLWTGSERINLTRMPKDERNKLLKQFNIPEIMENNKSIKCESFMTCCLLNLSGLQENKLMNMQQYCCGATNKNLQ